MEGGEECAIHVKTVQSAAFRSLFEVLKDVLCDCNLIFDESGIKLLTMDNNQCVLVSVKLSADKFEVFHCARRMVVGINVANMFRLIKSLGSSDTLTIKVLERESSKMVIVIDNYDKNTSTLYKLNQLDIDEMRLKVPNTEFPSVLTMPSADFQRICRDMALLSDSLWIGSSGRKLVLRAVGDFAEQITTIGEREAGMTFSTTSEEDSVRFGRYSLKYLSVFSKASVMCGTVDLYMQPDYPLVLSYSCASLGKLLFVLGRLDDDRH